MLWPKRDTYGRRGKPGFLEDVTRGRVDEIVKKNENTGGSGSTGKVRFGSLSGKERCPIMTKSETENRKHKRARGKEVIRKKPNMPAVNHGRVLLAGEKP